MKPYYCNCDGVCRSCDLAHGEYDCRDMRYGAGACERCGAAVGVHTLICAECSRKILDAGGTADAMKYAGKRD